MKICYNRRKLKKGIDRRDILLHKEFLLEKQFYHNINIQINKNINFKIIGLCKGF